MRFQGQSSEFGHYYAIIRDKLQMGSQWIRFDDSILSKINSDNDLEDLLQKSTEDTPYLLFYAKQDRA